MSKNGSGLDTREEKSATKLLRGLLAGVVMSVVVAGPGGAQPLQDALRQAYDTNPSIQAERARQRATRELKPQAWSGALPQVTAGGSVNRADQTQVFAGGTFPDQDVTLDQVNAQVDGELVLFNGLRNVNTIRQARARVDAGGAQLVSVEQDVLLRAAGAYFDVVRDQTVFKANANNVSVLMRQKEEADLRFRVGDVTRTDVAQAEARLAGAKAQLAVSQGQLSISRAQYQELVGAAPGALEEDPAMPSAPTSLDEALILAQEFSPAAILARANEKASRRQVAIARSAFSPEIAITSNYQYAEQPSSFIESNEQFSYGVRASVPIFLGGLNISRVREAKALNEADRRRITEAERSVAANVTAAWSQLLAAQATITSAESQLSANDLALTGVRREAQLGARTTLDVLNAEQEFLNSAVSLANAKRDERFALFSLLASTGVLTLDVVTGASDGLAGN